MRLHAFIAAIAPSLALCAASPAFEANFGRDRWDKAAWQNIKGPRWTYVLDMVQKDDHIENWCDPAWSPEEVHKKHCSAVYAAIATKEKFTIPATVSSTMAFDWRMAPLIVLAESFGADAQGRPEFREHYEIVLFDEGLNVWHHIWKDGKPAWYKAAFVKAKFDKNRRYTLGVKVERTRKGQKQLTLFVDGVEMGGYVDDNLPESFHAGVIGCEGRNMFYDFKVVK